MGFDNFINSKRGSEVCFSSELATLCGNSFFNGDFDIMMVMGTMVMW